jgi:hypothetical protein
MVHTCHIPGIFLVLSNRYVFQAYIEAMDVCRMGCTSSSC